MPRGIPGSGPNAGRTKRKQVPRTPKGLKREITLLKRQLEAAESDRTAMAARLREPARFHSTRTGRVPTIAGTIFADKEAIWDMRARRTGVAQIAAALIVERGSAMGQPSNPRDLVDEACRIFDEIETQVSQS